MIAVFAISTPDESRAPGLPFWRMSTKQSYRYRTAAAAISSIRKIGTSRGGTSHSRTLNLRVSDI